MDIGSEKHTLQRLEGLLAPYANQTLSAFDNMKLVFAVISAADNGDEMLKSPEAPIAYEIELKKEMDVSSEVEMQSQGELTYCVIWQDQWIYCGQTKDYSAEIHFLMSDGKKGFIQRGVVSDNSLGDDKAAMTAFMMDPSSFRSLNVPVLSLQQIEFMCMEYSHFDHC